MLAIFLLLALATPPTEVTPASEVTRIQAHLATVDRELRAADVTALSAAQRARRAVLIDDLAAYRNRGVFPRNITLALQTPFFIDDRGVRCAMAHLIETHDGATFVARIAATANNAYVRDLDADPVLLAWLDANGLTAAEAARIQPSYPKMPGERCDGFSVCQDSTCERSLDEPDLAYCAAPCDPAASSCPVGVEGVAMACQPRGDRNVCVYPEPTPGSTGWPCDLSATGQLCVWACVPSSDTASEGVCAPACSNDRACPADYACEPLEGTTDYLRTCLPVAKGGCSAAPPTTSWPALLGLLLVTARRRRRRARTRAR